MTTTWWARAGLSAALGVAGVFAAGGAWLAHSAGEEATDAADALAAARTRVPALLSYDVATLDEDLDRAIDQTTGDFRSDYVTIIDKAVRPKASKRGISTTAEVVGAGVVRAESDRVVVLVLLNQVSTGRKRDQTVAGSRIEVEMVRDGDTWRIAGLTPL